MSTDNDQLEQMLGQDLHRQVDGMGVVPFGFDEVRGRARRIRRNRRIAAGVGAAAVFAVMVPVGLSTDWTTSSKDEIQPAPSPSPDAPAKVSRTTLTLSGLPRGDAPAVEYFTPDGVVLPGEGTKALPENYQALVRSEALGGWIALGPARDEVVSLSEEFERQGGSKSSDAGFTATPKRDYVAWTARDVGAQTLGVRSTSDPNKATFWDFPEFPAVGPVGILGPDSVVYETLTAQGRTKVGLANPDGTTTELPYLNAFAADPVNGLISVQTKVQGTGGCFAVIESATMTADWETCGYKLGSFSPDGRYVMAVPPEGDGLGPTQVSVLDARTGDLVAQFASTARDVVTLIRPVWESADTIVATAMEGNTTTMVRMGIDGTLEEVVDPVDTSAYGDLYYYTGEDRSVL